MQTLKRHMPEEEKGASASGRAHLSLLDLRSRTVLFSTKPRYTL